MTFDPRARPRRRFGWGLALAVLVGVAILVALGVWQLQRLAWKDNLLARIAALQSAPAEPLEVVLRRIPDQVDIEYVRVQTTCPDLEKLPTVRLYAIKEGMIGYRLIAACPISAEPYKTILVDRGFIPRDVVDTPPTPVLLSRPIIGVLRKGDAGSIFTPANRPAANDWYRRDIPAMAAQLHAPNPAPIFMMLESPAPTGPGPQPFPVPTDIPNNHLSYALTWFGLALSLIGVYIAKLIRDRKA